MTNRRLSHPFLSVAAIAIFFALFATPARAADWPGWRGPTGMGYTEEKNLPLHWDIKTGQNILWKVALPKTTGHSSPIVWGDRVFLTTAAKQTNAEEKDKIIPEHHLCCFQASDGKLLWRAAIAPGKEPMGYAIYAVPTPITDGKAIYCWFGSAVVAAVDFDGKLLWRHERSGPFKLNPGIASSPALYQDTVLLLCDQGGGGWLQALDTATGEIKWEQKRAKLSYCNTSPVLISVKDKPELLIQASNQLQALDPSNGQPIWWCKAKGFGASPVYHNGLIFSDSGNGEAGLVVDPTGSGDVTATNIKWQFAKTPSQYGSGIIAGDYVYRAYKSNIKCWKLASGEEVFSESADGVPYLSSPIVTGDGLVYFAGANRSYVVKPGPKLEVLAVNDLKSGDNIAASAAVANGRIFIRGDQMLFCIGEK